MKFNNIFYWTQYTPNIFIQYVIDIVNINELFYLFFLTFKDI